MKIRQKAQQRNFYVDTDMYTQDALSTMWAMGIIDKLDLGFNYESPYIVYACDCTDIKVICLNGYYHTVAVRSNGTIIFVTI